MCGGCGATECGADDEDDEAEHIDSLLSVEVTGPSEPEEPATDDEQVYRRHPLDPDSGEDPPPASVWGSISRLQSIFYCLSGSRSHPIHSRASNELGSPLRANVGPTPPSPVQLSRPTSKVSFHLRAVVHRPSSPSPHTPY